MKYLNSLISMATKLWPTKLEPTTVDATSKTLIPVTEGAQWIKLSQLPGLTQDAIRAMGKSVFGPLTNTPVSNIEVIANLAGQGPNSQRDIDLTANELQRMTSPSNMLEYSSDQMKHLFGGAYQAQAIQFENAGYAYLLVKDPVGSYIYRWPAADTKQRTSRLGPRPAITGPD